MDDYITKEYLTEHIKACWINGRPKHAPELHEVLSWIDEVPPVDVQPVRWIPWDSGSFPDDSGTYIVTAYDGAKERVTFAKFQKRLKRWELTGARAYWRVLAWMPLPPSYKGDET